MKGVVIGGEVGAIIAREKPGEKIELGELLVSDNSSCKILLQVYDLSYGSQFSQQDRELMSGLHMEDSDTDFFEKEHRSYVLAKMKSLLTIKNAGSSQIVSSTKCLPDFFSSLRKVVADDLRFLNSSDNSLFLGNVRSGSKVLDVPVRLDGRNVLSHHILVTGTTGRGKSVFLSTLLWEIAKNDWCGVLVLDPHDEYIGRTRVGLKDHPRPEKIFYYTSDNSFPGCRSLKICITVLRPGHFDGIVEWSSAQEDCINAYYRRNPSGWIEDIVREVPLSDSRFHESTVAVVKRRILNILNLSISNNNIVGSGIFDVIHGEGTVRDIVNILRAGCVVLVDTSRIGGRTELLFGSIISNEILKSSKISGEKNISVLIEEAPRVLGIDVLERGSNIFATIAREGRKFGVGLIAVTQLPSLIPRSILANMNTKIILGTEMKPERTAIIESASQDLSSDDRAIASLDRGEAIVTTNFSRFAIPVKFPSFEEHALKDKSEKIQKRLFGS